MLFGVVGRQSKEKKTKRKKILESSLKKSFYLFSAHRVVCSVIRVSLVEYPG